MSVSGTRTMNIPPVITLPTGTVLYRGVLDKGNPHLGGFAWFATNIKDANIYGYVHKFQVSTPIKLIDMSKKHTFVEMSACYKVFAEENKKSPHAFTSSFGLSENEMARDSEFLSDQLVIDMMIWARKHKVCGAWFQAVDGFGAPQLPTQFGDPHHPEYLILNPSQKITHTGLVPGNYNDAKIASMKIIKNQLLNKQKYKSTRVSSRKKRIQMQRFSDSDEDSEPESENIAKNLSFGNVGDS
jgi:hypothetical protein